MTIHAPGQILLLPVVPWLERRARRRRPPPPRPTAAERQRPDLMHVRPMTQLALQGVPPKTGVRLVCVRIEGGRLRVRVVGDSRGLFVRFSRELRAEGTLYEVDGVKLVETRGQSYWRIIGTPREVPRIDLFASGGGAAAEGASR